MKSPSLYFLSSSVVCAALLAACGGSGTPSAPSQTPTAPVPRSVTVSSTNSAIVVGATEQMSAVTVMSDGRSQPATGTWGSDNPSVATVSAGGLVTGRGTGDATITIDAQGIRGTKTIRVVPGVSGTYTGAWTVDTCSLTGLWSSSPCITFPKGARGDFTVVVRQTNGSVSGSFQVGGTTFPSASGSVGAGGDFTMTAHITYPDVPGQSADATVHLVPNGSSTGGDVKVAITAANASGTPSGSIMTLTGPLDLRRTSNATSDVAIAQSTSGLSAIERLLRR